MIDLKKEFGGRYKVFHDPSWDAETAANRKLARESGQEPWYYELRGPMAQVYPVGQDTLGVRWCGKKGSARLKQASISSRGLDGERTYIIALNPLKGVLSDLKCTKKRMVSESEKARLRALSAIHGFKKA